MKTLTSSSRFVMVCSFLACAPACGGSEVPEAKTPDAEETSSPRREGPAMAASAEIGALDEGKVTSTFRKAQAALEKCVHDGAERNEYEGGDVAFFLKIDTRGKAIHVHAEKSTLGDRETEKCMISVLKRQSWPEPQGGDVGIARNSFGFDMVNTDTRPPTEWDAARVQETLGEVSSELGKCKGGVRGELTATVYVDPDGAALSAGVAASDESGEEAADCVVSVLKGAKYPSPGSWPAKVTFPL